jgi:putative heme-binding domain-containing protein
MNSSLRFVVGLSYAVAFFLGKLWFATAQTAEPIQAERLFQSHCAACHGPKGEGAMGPTLAVPKLGRATNDELLFSIIKDGIAGTEMPRSRLNSDEIQQLVTYVRKLGQVPSETMTGNAKRGEQLYFAKGNCQSCHAINGHGSAFGPDLSEIGLRRGGVHLRTSLLDPEADVPKSFGVYRPGTSIADNFLQVRVVTKDGQRLKGVRVNEDTFTIQLREASGRVHSFFKAELSELHKDWGKSPMPSYREVFSKEEMNDVVAFLLSLRGEK